MTDQEREADLGRRLAALAAAIAEAEGTLAEHACKEQRRRLERLNRKADGLWAAIGNLGAQMARTGGNR